MNRKRHLLGRVGLAAICAGWCGIGWAQQTPPDVAPAQSTATQPGGSLAPPGTPAVASDSPTGEIVVTGSRIARRDFQADSPIATVQAQALQNQSPVTLDNALSRQPQFTGINGQSQTGSGFGQTGAATLNLRNLGDNRNLVLLDGRRLEPSTTSFAVDINNLPAALIENVEVITGGASAVYGSDAVAGVVNFKLKHNFEGLEVDAKGGLSGRGDYGNTDDALTAGANFNEDRGNVVVSFDYAHRGGTLQRDIPFYKKALRDGTGAFALGFLDVGYYQPELDTIRGTTVPNWPGFPATAALGPQELGFNTDHTTIFNIGTAAGYNSGVYPQNPTYAINNGVKYNSNYNEYATTPLERYSGFGRFEYKVLDDLSVYGQALYTHYTVKNSFIPLPAANDWAVQVPRDAGHPVPAAFASQLDSRPDATAPWSFGRALSFLGQPTTTNTADTFQGVVGISGRIPTINWTFDVYGSHGHSSVESIGDQGFTLEDRYKTLVLAPNYGAGFNNGAGAVCTSGISPFIDAASITQDCKDYLTYQYKNRLSETQDVAEADFQGKFADLPGGEWRGAFGVDYRRNSLNDQIDPQFELDPALGNGTGPSYVVGNFSAYSSRGSSSVYELYAETLLPIVRDVPFIRSLTVDAAYRYSHYRLSGGVSTYKADGNWEVTDFLRFRGGYQRAVRAPNVTELFGAQQSQIVIPAFDPCVNAGPFAIPPGHYGNNAANPDQSKVQALCTALTPSPPSGLYNLYVGNGTPVLVGQVAGNSALKPEKADTYTIGAVLTPHRLPLNSRLSASIDYYSIRVSKAVAALDPNQAYELCFNDFGTNPSYSPESPYCRTVVRDVGSGFPANVNIRYENQGGLRTRGIDAQVDWSVPVGPGRLDFNGIVNYLIDFKISFAPGVPFVNYADTVSSTQAYFRLRSLLTTTYRIGNNDVGIRWKHLPGTRDSSCVSICTATGVSSYNLVDLFGTYQVAKGLSLTVGIDNLFDRAPPVLGGVPGVTNLGEYDIVGRQFYAAIRAKF